MTISGSRRWTGGARHLLGRRRGEGTSAGAPAGGTPVPTADAAVTRPQQRVRGHWPDTRHRYRRKARRLAQAALFAAVRGAAYALGAAVAGWFLYWLAQQL
ncbi:hypothetical protein ACLQ2P_41840 [Actinomadura citrea]|uniref:hypothetical protein n=1 Tax=Actinomadura citrea TaxID=46158 RepID=UPI003CE50436